MFDTTVFGNAAEATTEKLHAGVAGLASEELDDWHGDSLSNRLVGLLELRERMDAEVTRTAAAWSRRRAWEADGALSPSAWLAHRAPVSGHDARRVVKAARAVNASSHLAESLQNGSSTSAHVAALASVLSPRREPLLAEHGELLAKQAEKLPIKDFTLLARRWASLADDELAAEDHEDATPPPNELHAAVTLAGRLDGHFNLDPISGAKLLGALDHLAPPDPVDAPDGPRSLAERRGDALADLAGMYHDGERPAANPPNLDVLVDVATLTGLSPPLAERRCELDGIGSVTKATLDQLGCGATVRRVVMAGPSVVLDMGRKVRFATAPQARAVRVRDGGCIFPSCGRTPKWCDIHHVDDWAAGGNTDVDRMCCLCRRHHRLIHNSKWRIEVQPDGSFRVTHPIRAP